MTEYIDRETVKEIMQKYRCSDCTNDKSLDCPLCQLHRPFAEISKLPTADVVQKSEYNRLEKSFNELISVLPENMHFMTNEQERGRDNAENL